MPAGLDQEGDPELQQGDQRRGVSLMLIVRKRRDIGWLAVASISAVLLMQPGRAQTAAAGGNLADQLVGMDNPPDIDVAALRQQVADRIKAKADATAVKRPPIAPVLLKLPQFRFDVVFDPDSSLIRPDSYGVIGRIADALADPKMLPYSCLIVDHTESTGRRDANLALSQRRADSIREVLVGTFKISGKRLQSLGLGEEQLQDSVRPASPVNVRAQIMTVGLTPAPPPPAVVPPAQKSAAKSAKAAKKRH
jgi:OmpA-OmpF porin, OOP family